MKQFKAFYDENMQNMKIERRDQSGIQTILLTGVGGRAALALRELVEQANKAKELQAEVDALRQLPLPEVIHGSEE